MSPSPAPLPRSYVGILNQGSTCYLNSVIQALFHLPYFRYKIYSITALQQNPLAVELRNLFAQLDACSGDITTLELTRAFGWNAYETSFQHDVHEMVQQLFDCLETTLKDTPHANFIRDLFSGFLAFRSRIVDGSGDYVADRLQRFYDVELVVKDKHNMDESLRELVTPEKIDGVRLELKPGAPATTHNIERSQRFVQLPPVLLIHPNRAAFDMETGEPITLGNRWAFAADIDLAPYVTDPRELRLDAESTERMQQLRERVACGNDNEEEEQQQQTATAATTRSQGGGGGGSSSDDSDTLASLLGTRRALGTRYRLRAILTHAGNINIGHYYTYVNFRNHTSSSGSAGGSGSSAEDENEESNKGSADGDAAAHADDMRSDAGVWLRFNDEVVEEASAREVQRSAFGESVSGNNSGGGAASYYASGDRVSPSQSYFRNERASLLVYVNVDCEEAVLREMAQPPPQVLAIAAKLERQRAPAPAPPPVVARTIRYFRCEDVVDLLDEVPNAMERAHTIILPPPSSLASAQQQQQGHNNNNNGADDDVCNTTRVLDEVRQGIAAHLGLAGSADDVRRVRLLHFALTSDASDGVSLWPVTPDRVDESDIFVAQVLPSAPTPSQQQHEATVASHAQQHHHHHHHHHSSTQQQQQSSSSSSCSSSSKSASASDAAGGKDGRQGDNNNNNDDDDDDNAPFLALLRGIRQDGSFVLPVRVAHSRAALTQLIEQYIRDETHNVQHRLYSSALGRLLRVQSLADVPDGANLLLCPRTLTVDQVQSVMQSRQHEPKQVTLVDHHNIGVYTPLYVDAVSNYTPYSVMQARVHAWMARHAPQLCPPSADHIAFHYVHPTTGQALVTIARSTHHLYSGEVREEEIGRLCGVSSSSSTTTSSHGGGSHVMTATTSSQDASNNSNSSNNASTPTALLYCSVLPRPLSTLNTRVLVRFNAGWGAQPCVYVGKHVQQLTLDALVAEALTQIRSDCVSRELRERCTRARHHHHHHHSQQQQQHNNNSSSSSSTTSDRSSSSSSVSASEATAQQQRLPIRLLQVHNSRIVDVIDDPRQLIDLTQGHQYVLDPLSPELPGYEVVDVQFCSRRSSGEAYFGTPTNISVTCDMQENGHSLLLRVAKKLKVPDAETVVHKWIICVKGVQSGTIRTAGRSDTLARLVKEVGGKPYCFLVDRPQVVALDGAEDERKEQAIVIRSSSSNELSSL